ncbi:MAG: ribonuclease R [Dichotomicrobium sp.]
MSSKTSTPPGSNARDDTPDRLPSKQDIVTFIEESPGEVGKREIARAFHIKGSDRVALKQLLREMADEGLIKGKRKRLRKPGELPNVTVIEITGRDADGEFMAYPAAWTAEEDGPPPRILIAPVREAGPAAGVGDRVLARIEPVSQRESELEEGGYAYIARPIKRLSRDKIRQLGVFRERGPGGVITPIDKKQLKEFRVEPGRTGGAEDGELVRFETARRGRFEQLARVMERLGHPKSQRAVSLIAIHAYELPYEFPDRVLNELDSLPEPDLEAYEDLRNLPLITIDPEDARDHDDAVWAAPDDDPANKGGWVVIVAIADVAFYVRPGSAIDAEALKRGNSVYFPDRVVPMLPEKLSNELCSLRPEEDRLCLAVRMVFNADGSKRGHSFMRATMRSRAKLHYAQAQAAVDGTPDEMTKPLLEPVLKPLWGAYRALAKARDRRGPLDLDVPERKIRLREDGEIAEIVIPERLEAHRLIEEFMIQANVAAAEFLEAENSPLLYRVHDTPGLDKLEATNEFLQSIGYKLPKSGVMKPEQFNRILERARDSEYSLLVNDVILRTQAQAEYSVGNYGHFGLNLRRYAHFTSPIRRYADLVVHRSLVRALGGGPGALTDEEVSRLDKVAEDISNAERRAMAAERDTIDRLVAAYLEDQTGAVFKARISGVTRAGLFVRLSDTGADGFIPISTIGKEYYAYSSADHALIGERSGETFRLGDSVEVRLIEAIPEAGALRFELLSEGRHKSQVLGKKRAERAGAGVTPGAARRDRTAGKKPGGNRGAKKSARRK